MLVELAYAFGDAKVFFSSIFTSYEEAAGFREIGVFTNFKVGKFSKFSITLLVESEEFLNKVSIIS